MAKLIGLDLCAKLFRDEPGTVARAACNRELHRTWEVAKAKGIDRERACDFFKLKRLDIEAAKLFRIAGQIPGVSTPAAIVQAQDELGIAMDRFLEEVGC